MLSRLERTLWGRLLLFCAMLPWVILAAVVWTVWRFAVDYLIRREFGLEELQ